MTRLRASRVEGGGEGSRGGGPCQLKDRINPCEEGGCWCEGGVKSGPDLKSA